MNKTLKWIIISVGALVLLLVILKMTGVIGKDQGIKVAVEKSARRTITEVVSASGKVYPEVEVKITPDVSGEIVELNVEEGDSVKKGQVLAKIYADIYSSQRDQASAQVAQQQAQLQNSAAASEAAKARLDLAKQQYDRNKKLFDQKVISKSEFEQAENTYKTAQADYTSAMELINGGKAGVQSAQAGLNRANKDISRTIIVSPMDGVVSILNVKKGEKVSGNSFTVGTEMMRVSDLSVYEVQVDVGENDIVKVHLGDTALVEVDAYNNRKFKGVVSKIASSSSALSSQSSAISGNDATNYKVHVRLMPDSYKDLIKPGVKKSFPFRPGMNANADIQTSTHLNVLAVSIKAVTPRDKGDTLKEGKHFTKTEKKDDNANNNDDLDEVVFAVQKDGTVKRIKVTTGIQDINYIEVLSGLSGDEEIVTEPYSAVSKTLKNGTKVKVVSKDQIFEKEE